MAQILSHFTNLLMECCAVGVAPLIVHARYTRPLIGFGRVALCAAQAILAVVASHGIDGPVQFCHAHVAAAVVHGRHLIPGVCADVQLADVAEMLHSVEAANTVKVSIEKDGAVVGPRMVQICWKACPDVRAGIVRLNLASWIAAPASTDEHDGSRQTRTGIRVRETWPRTVSQLVPYGFEGIIGDLTALRVATHQRIGRHSAPNVG